MSRLFLEELGLPEPDHLLSIKSLAPYRQGDHTGRMMVELEKIILDEMPSVVLVHGDTNTTLAGALVTSKISTTRSFTGYDIKLAHVEAGLRSYDRSMPEEINRVIADHLSHFLFVPTPKAKDTVIGEGITAGKVTVTGNTIVDALESGRRRIVPGKLPEGMRPLAGPGYILLTLHRQENVDNRERVSGMIRGISDFSSSCGLPVLFPAHPRTVKMFGEFGINIPGQIKMIPPCGFLDFLSLEDNARLIFTDSGGVQEEACVLRTPCVTLRTSTERPETVEAGANIVAGVSPAGIIKAAEKMYSSDRKWDNPLGDGHAAAEIIGCLKEEGAVR
jgi:UDP-N-acetylglucosamine 2-epimerase (non-hydrolysing)